MPMQANELRIGNLVNYSGNVVYFPKGYIIVDEIRDDGINSATEYHPLITLDEIEPIPLTPEILSQCGFEKTYAKDAYKKIFSKHSLHFLVVTLREDGNIVSILDEYTGREVVTVFVNKIAENLHQLQNLYFSLTGTELEVNLMNAPKEP